MSPLMVYQSWGVLLGDVLVVLLLHSLNTSLQLSTCSREDSKDDSDDVVEDSGVVDSGWSAPVAAPVVGLVDSPSFVAVDFAVVFVAFDSPFVAVVVVCSTMLSLVSSLVD